MAAIPHGEVSGNRRDVIKGVTGTNHEAYSAHQVVEKVAFSQIKDHEIDNKDHEIVNEDHEIGRSYHEIGKNYHEIGKNYHEISKNYTKIGNKDHEIDNNGHEGQESGTGGFHVPKYQVKLYPNCKDFKGTNLYP
jgi:hypothetical protein